MEKNFNQEPGVVVDNENCRPDAVKLQKKVGNAWQHVPGSSDTWPCWYLAGDGLQFTVVRYFRERWDVAMYLYPTREEFMSAFANQSHASNAVYFQTSTGETITDAILRFLEECNDLSLLDE